jgi:hypothetical protein
MSLGFTKIAPAPCSHLPSGTRNDRIIMERAFFETSQCRYFLLERKILFVDVGLTYYG